MKFPPAGWALVFLVAMAVQERSLATQAADDPPNSITIRADWFDRGNVRVSLPGESYADRYACIWNAGQVPNQSEYDLDIPVSGEYTIAALYAAKSSRPVEIHLDGQRIHTGFASVTGSWQTTTARWEVQCRQPIDKGRHTIKLLCPGPCMPHICALRLESSTPFPKGWKLDRPIARQKLQPVPTKPIAGHRIPEVPLLASLDKGLAVEVVEPHELAAGSSPLTNELLMKPAHAVPSGEPSPWVASLSLAAKDGSVKRAAINLSPDRLQDMLARTIRLIDDFRTMDGVAADYLDAERVRCGALQTEVNAVADRPESKSKWQQFCQLYLEAFRLQRQVAMANPLVDFDRLLLVKRSVNSPALGLPQNWQSDCVLPTRGFDNEIAVLSPVSPDGKLTTLYRPEKPCFVGDVDLCFNGTKLLFSSVGEYDKYHVFEIGTDGTGLRQVTPSLEDVHNYDACYLPDGGIIFSSTASMAAVPCVNGSTRVANFYRLDPDGTIRQLCFDQEHNWCPTVLPSGRVLYLRWEYTDTPHAHDRVLFSMNPDGTSQMEYYGSNSYWPNSLFYARPIPERPGMFVSIVSGHHGVRRMGELVLFNSSQGRREAAGAIQRIPGHGQKVASETDPKYESTLIQDKLVDDSWPRFLHPYPLSDKYFLVACQPTAESLWGIYLVDVFDNMVLVAEAPGYAMFEPVPLRPTPRPPVIPPKVDLARRDGVVYMADVYAGGGLKGIPRGTVKRLRLISYHYLFPGMGGPQGVVGMEGPWDIKRIIGTVPVEADGSAVFRVPANTPIAVQPLDAEGKAVQLMRSWFTAMPGEVLSCVGCHESQNTSPPADMSRFAGRRPSEIEPWHGPPRGFNFEREVQPVLDRYCVGCHNGQPDTAGRTAFDLRGLEEINDYKSVYHYGGKDAGHFSTSYVALHQFVRRPGLESDYHMLMPMEFHADTTQLVQMLAAGHHNVVLDDEAWDRLITWIDLNAPYHGTWTEIAGKDRVRPLAERRRELLKRYAGVDSNPESEANPGPRPSIDPILPEPMPVVEAAQPVCDDWPFDAAEATRRQQALGPCQESIELGDGITMELVRVPGGKFVMGTSAASSEAQSATVVEIKKPFWMGRLEVTNRQFAAFDATHDSRVEARFAMQFGVRGFYVNGPDQPVVRVSWQQAMAFCDWLSRRTGRRFSLPTEAQWEYACRAGTATPFYYGDRDTDFSRFANLADAKLSEFVCHPYKKERVPYASPSKYDDWIPKDSRFNDGGFLSEKGGVHEPNAWGLCDMHGNVAEWTRSAFRPYPYRDDSRNEPTGSEDRVVRGGSWHDRPLRAESGFRLHYRPYQPVYNVGFRVICEEETRPLARNLGGVAGLNR